MMDQEERGECRVDRKSDTQKSDNISYLAVFAIQAVYAGMALLQKAVFDSGMNTFIFVFYRQAVATAFLVPLAFYFNWKNAPSLTFKTAGKIFVIFLLGITGSLDMYGVGLKFTSATLASATTNCLPAITFFLAVLFWLICVMETWKIKTTPGVAKLVGIVMCIGGALVLALYKGITFKHLGFMGHHFHHQSTWIKGVFLMITSNALFAVFMVLQGPILKMYPSKLLFNTVSCFLSSIQAFIVAIAIERDPTEWRLGWDLRLLSVAYCGVVVTGVAYYLISFVIERRGAVFLTMWTPLCFAITTFFSLLFLREDLNLGSILGGILLIVGLYSMSWAKRREESRSISIQIADATVVQILER